MSSNPAPEVSPVRCLALFAGTIIENPGTEPKTITGLSFLEMGEYKTVKIPADANLEIPEAGVVNAGVKAGSGTPVKLTTGTVVGHGTGTAATQPISIRVPACTLREPSSGTPETKLSDGARITNGATPFLVLEPLDFELDK